MNVLQRISLRILQRLEAGESTIVGPFNAAGQVSTEFIRLRPMEFTQRRVLVIEPNTGELQKMFQVTRTK